MPGDSSHSAVRALLEASSVLLSNHELPDVLQGILNIAQRALDADAHAVWREVDGHWQISAARGLSEAYMRQPPLMIGMKALTEPALFDDIRKHPVLQDRIASFQQEGIVAVAVLPIPVQNGSSATIAFYYRTPHRFTTEELEYARIIANLAGAAIANAELIRRQAESAKRSEILAHITSLFNSSLDFDRTAQSVADSVVPQLADWCGLSFYENGQMTHVAIAHQDPAMIAVAEEFSFKYPERLNPERGVMRVLQTGEPELVTGITDEMLVNVAQNEEHLALLRKLDVRSVITVPLKLAGRILGVLRLISGQARPDLSAADVQFAEEIAARAANALINADLYRRAQQEIEHRRAAEAKLDRERNFLSLAQRVTNSGSWELDLRADPVTAYWSPELIEMYGLQPEQFSGLYQAWIDALHPDDRGAAVESLTHAIEQQTPWQHEFRIVRPDKTVRWIAGRGQCFYGEDGKPRNMIGINMDVTERRATEAALLRSEKLSSAGRLAATIAHEINNPLEAITNLVFLARTGEPEFAARMLEEADRELQRVAHITRQTLGFYRETTAPHTFDIAETARQVVTLLAGQLQRRELNVELDVQPVEIDAVEGEIRQAISNLVVNAIDASPIGGEVSVRIRLTWLRAHERRRRAVRISVADHGMGIPKVQRAYIFEPFFTTKQDLGTGLGLWVVREIVSKHSGIVQVRSQISAGTVVSIVLPLSEDPLV